MATKAQAKNLALARAAKTAKAAQAAEEANSMVGKLNSNGFGGGIFKDMLDASYVRDTAKVQEVAPHVELPDYGTQTREALQGSTTVGVYDSATVEALRAELAMAQGRIAVMEQTISAQPQPGRDAMGRRLTVYPEPAEDYVAAEDMPNDLDFFNDIETKRLAIQHGKPKAGMSKILHSNSVTKWEGGALQSATFWMYAPDGTARRIMRQSVESAKHSGLSTSCPKCGGWHKDSEDNPNACPAKPRCAFTLCPVCESESIEHPIFDTPTAKPLDRFGNEIMLTLKLKDDPNYVSLESELPADSKNRLVRRLQDHIRAFHESTAASMKLMPFQKVQAGQTVV